MPCDKINGTGLRRNEKMNEVLKTIARRASK
jgi:hypothetical protein